jgi:glutathione S-transferase
MNLWFLGGAVPKTFASLIAGFARLEDWRSRVRAIGHGDRAEMTPAEALEVARSSEPAPYGDHDPADLLGLAPGAPVRVMADDYGREPIDGVLVAANAQRVVLARQDPALGRLQVHFPRVGYVVTGR